MNATTTLKQKTYLWRSIMKLENEAPIELPKELWKKKPNKYRMSFPDWLRHRARVWLRIDHDIRALNRDIVALMEKQMINESLLRKDQNDENMGLNQGERSEA